MTERERETERDRERQRETERERETETERIPFLCDFHNSVEFLWSSHFSEKKTRRDTQLTKLNAGEQKQ